jgi:hypothetical protein
MATTPRFGDDIPVDAELRKALLMKIERGKPGKR